MQAHTHRCLFMFKRSHLECAQMHHLRYMQILNSSYGILSNCVPRRSRFALLQKIADGIPAHIPAMVFCKKPSVDERASELPIPFTGDGPLAFVMPLPLGESIPDRCVGLWVHGCSPPRCTFFHIGIYRFRKTARRPWQHRRRLRLSPDPPLQRCLTFHVSLPCFVCLSLPSSFCHYPR